MNIFVLDEHPRHAAEAMCDQHIRKMGIEAAQILSTVLWIKGTEDTTITLMSTSEFMGWNELDYAQLRTAVNAFWDDYPDKYLIYNLYNPNNRFVQWAAANSANWNWLHTHAMFICDEYEYRFGSKHKVSLVLDDLPHPDIPHANVMTPFTRCDFRDNNKQIIKEIHNIENTVDAYQEYYRQVKSRFAAYTRRLPPMWLKSSLDQLIA